MAGSFNRFHLEGWIIEQSAPCQIIFCRASEIILLLCNDIKVIIFFFNSRSLFFILDPKGTALNSDESEKNSRKHI